MLKLVILGLLVSSVYGLYGANTKVQILTTANFNSKVIDDKESIWLVEFFAPWCGHCKNLAPEWEKAAKALEGFVNIGAVDMTTDQSVGAPYSIQGYPTLKLFSANNKGSPQDYSGGRTAKDIIDFAIRQVRDHAYKKIGFKPSTGGSESKKPEAKKEEEKPAGDDDKDVVVLTDENFDDIVYNSKEAWFIKFYAPWCGHCKNLAPTWAKLGTAFKGTDIKIAKLDATTSPNLGKRFGVSGYPSLKFLPNAPRADSEAIDYNGGRDLSTLEEWAKNERDKNKPLQFNQLINQGVFEEFCANFKGVCIIAFFPHIYDSSAAEREGYMGVVEKVASDYKGKPFSFLWSEGGTQLALEQAFVVGGSGYPCVLALSNSKRVSAVMRGAFTENNFREFIKNLLAGKGAFVAYKQEVPAIVVQKAWDGRDRKPSAPTEDL